MNLMTNPAAAVTVDPITLQVIRGSFETIAEEMGHVGSDAGECRIVR